MRSKRLTIAWMENVLTFERINELLFLAQKNKKGRHLLARYIAANVNQKLKGKRNRGDGQ